MLRNEVKTRLDKALKEQDKFLLGVLRNLWAAIKNAEIDLHEEMTDEQVINLIKKQHKAVAEAKAMFEKGGRADLAKENEKEMAILAEYLPAEISDEELKAKIQAVLAAHPEIVNPGQQIGLCVRELKNVAESSRIAALIKTLN